MTEEQRAPPTFGECRQNTNTVTNPVQIFWTKWIWKVHSYYYCFIFALADILHLQLLHHCSLVHISLNIPIKSHNIEFFSGEKKVILIDDLFLLSEKYQTLGKEKVKHFYRLSHKVSGFVWEFESFRKKNCSFEKVILSHSDFTPHITHFLEI